MIITLVKANFSANNIGSLGSFAVLTNILNATYSGPTSIEKDGAYTATITMYDGYAIPDTISVLMGGTALSDACTINGNVITINIAKVTGIIVINMAGVAIEGGSITILPLVQGYIDNKTLNSSQLNRIRSEGLINGPFSLELNEGYAIRAIYEYDVADYSAGGTAIVTAAENLTAYTGGSVGKFYGITLCKTVPTENLSPTDNIVKSFACNSITPIVDNTQPEVNPDAGTDVAYVLRNGAWVQNGSADGYSNRIRTTERIKGKFTVNVNDGYAIRAVYEYPSATSTAGTMVAATSNSRTTFTSTDANKYYGVTFTWSGSNENVDITPTENIVADWKYV